jgi:hypothetical protein
LAGYQTACTNAHCYATLLQWQDTKLHARMRTAALLQWQFHKLSGSFTNCLIE